MVLQNFYCKGSQPLLSAVSRMTCGKIATSSAPKCLNYFGNIIVQLQFTNLAAGCGLEIHGLVFFFSKNI
jgi:hypothetical protein